MSGIVLDIVGPCLDPYDSYGQVMIETAKGLAKRGVQVNPHAPRADYSTQDNEARAVLTQSPRPAVGSLAFGYPNLFEKFGADAVKRPRIAITMFESTVIPEDWADPLNECDAVIVPAAFLVNIFRAAGVTVPIKVIPLGISPAFQYINRQPGRGPFTFLAVGDRGMRKGWDLAVRAFHAAFGNDPNYRLIIKSRSKMTITVRTGGVEYLPKDMTEAEIGELFGAVDCFLFPTRGEGFGLWPRQAAATGLPVIATNWGGTADQIAAWGYPLRYEMADAWTDNPNLIGLGQWAEPDLDHLIQQMTYITTHQDGARYMGWQAARRVRKLYSWDAFAAGVLDVWREIAREKVGA